jgi:hypothetical protein
MEDRYDQEQVAENGSKCTMAMIRDFAEEVPADVESDGGSFSGAPLPRPKSTRKRKEVTKISTPNLDLAQKFGVLAVGEAVCRDFGADGIFYGTINAYRRESTGELYTVRYSDGDQEDLDTEEYNFAYALWLSEEGWNAEEADVNSEEGWTADEEEAFVEPVPVQTKSPKKVRNAILFYAPDFVTVTVFPLFCTGKRYCCTEN